MFNHKLAFLPIDAEVEGASDEGSSIGDSGVGEQSAEEDSDDDVSEVDIEDRRPEREMDMALGSYEGRDWLPVVALRNIPRGAEV